MPHVAHSDVDEGNNKGMRGTKLNGKRKYSEDRPLDPYLFRCSPKQKAVSTENGHTKNASHLRDIPNKGNCLRLWCGILTHVRHVVL